MAALCPGCGEVVSAVAMLDDDVGIPQSIEFQELPDGRCIGFWGVHWIPDESRWSDPNVIHECGYGGDGVREIASRARRVRLLMKYRQNETQDRPEPTPANFNRQ